MKVGTKSVLFGVHCFFIHPFYVASAWCRLYGFPTDIRLWTSFFVHDLGYLGKPNMDGAEGEKHPELGAKIMRVLFSDKWGEFALTHSRYYSKKLGLQPSKLCMADKLSTAFEPYWFYILRAKASGELKEYMFNSKYKSQKEWFKHLRKHQIKYALMHKDGKIDLVSRVRIYI
jgi:hypothetical protein